MQDTGCLGHRMHLLIPEYNCLQLCTPLQGLTPVYQAVKDCNLEVVKSILASGGDTT